MATQRQFTTIGEFYCINCDYWYNHLFPWMNEAETVWCPMCNKGISLKRLIDQMVELGEGRVTPHIKWQNRYIQIDQHPHDDIPTPYKED